VFPSKPTKAFYREYFKHIWACYLEVVAGGGYNRHHLLTEHGDSKYVTNVVRFSVCDWKADVNLAVKKAVNSSGPFRFDNPEHQIACAKEFRRRNLLPIEYFAKTDLR
jgi:hypothetical protein